MDRPPLPADLDPALSLGRRLFLLTATAALGAAGPATEPQFQDDGPRLLVAGPDGGGVDRWASRIAPPLARALTTQAKLRRELSGGPDGVTLANQLEARAVPDGSAAALLPGAAAQAWLVGDPRVHYDASRWVPLFAALSSAVLVGRLPDAALRANGHPGGHPAGRVRIAASTPAGPELPALLGLSLLGLRPDPLFGVTDDQALAALAAGDLDAVLLHGPELPTALNRLPAGVRPIFSLGGLDEDGNAVRDPLLPTVPHLAELHAATTGGRPVGPLWGAYAAAAAATRLEVVLVLPALTPAAMVALWRQACTQVGGTARLQAAVGPFAIRLAGPPVAGTIISAIAAEPPSQLELRRYLAMQLNWAPA